MSHGSHPVLPLTPGLGNPRRARAGTAPGCAFTLLELLVTVGIMAVLVLIALPQFHQALMRSKIAASKSNIHLIGEAMELYRLDHGRYPEPVVASPAEDPYGVIATLALRGLTTPVAYVQSATLRDSFGLIQAQSPAPPVDPFRPPTPRGNASSAHFNPQQSVLYFYYPRLASLVSNRSLSRATYALVSVGPDLKDSFIVYYPFPTCLPASAAGYGILQIQDTVYDPTNGTISGGDLAGFGPETGAPRLVGGGGQ